MIDCQEILTDLFESYEKELSAALDGDIEKYCYKEEITENEGTHDANYTNRLRLAYTILYTKKYEEAERIDGLILKLFGEELIDRETNSFQGIGSGLNVLSVLMNKYDVPVRGELFERARNANFDCYMGFSDPEGFVLQSIDAYSNDDTLHLLIELEEKELALKLLNEMIKSDSVVDAERMRFYRRCFHVLGDIDGEIDMARNIMGASILSSDSSAVCSDMLNLIRIINIKKDYEESCQIFDMLITRLDCLEGWYRIGLGRQVLEECMDIILNYDEAADKLWEWANPFLKMIVENMHGNLYKKASLAAYKMGDFKFSELLSNEYDELMLTTYNE